MKAFINREIRHVPLDWDHPRDRYGEYEPLQSRCWLTEEYIAEALADDPHLTRADIAARFMPDFSDVAPEHMGIQAYETTSEGTPISPAYPDTPTGRFALVQYLADHETTFGPYTATMEVWAAILFDDQAAAVNMADGTVELDKAPTFTN